ncbi:MULTISPECIES: Fic/DOC family N-terminal domain-containing protein [unclassified Frankia]|uniref:Fic/DOC family N-terminal domain-containing protein n=1 Tax=unclassified Frankia TaxID=2632575 RepID=UPI002024B9F6
MRREAFATGQQRHIVRAERGYLAFVPPPLPPALDLDRSLIRLLSDADRALGELAGAGRTLPNPRLLARALVRREAVLSSRIEGTQASVSDLVLFEAEQPARSDGADVREVFNYMAAVEHTLDPDRRLPLSVPLLREAHAILLSGVRGDYATPGDVRRSQNWIGAPGCTLDTATYVPPPPERLWECLDLFEKHLHTDHDLPPLVTIACAHYQFEAIHPFLDGNGRVGRLLVVLLLAEWGLLDTPMLDISAWIEPRRDEYYAHLLRVSTHGEWAGWVEFFLRGVAEQARDAVRRSTALHNLRNDYRARVSTARSSGLLAALVDALFDIPALTVSRARRILDVTHRSASLNVAKLVESGILTEVPGRARNRLFIADGILRTIEGEPDTSAR